jgi:hypothetical protein
MGNLEIKNLINILSKAKEYNLLYETSNRVLLHETSNRVFGVIEGILLCYGKLKPGGDWNYKEYQVEVTGWFGKKYMETRQQTYRQLMVELLQELINEEIGKLK